MADTVLVHGLTNREFLEAYARPGRIGLVGGSELINRLIRRAQRHQIADHGRSPWSHAFLFQGQRHDGHHWVIESDLDIRRKHIRLGVQENRVAKYHDDDLYVSVAVIDLGLTEAQSQRLLANALEHVAAGARYSLREIAGTAWALRHPTWRPQENRLAREQAYYCSAFVRHVFSQIGVELAEGIAAKNTTPHDIANCALPGTCWLLQRNEAPRGVRKLVQRVKARLHRE